MTAALLWKEYRQQRAVWLAIAILGILLVTLLAAIMGNGTLWEVFQDRHIRSLLNAVVFCLVITYGLLSGALLLAGELDEGTMVFLDCLTGQRGTLWARKCAAGALFTLFQSIALAGMAVGLGFMAWKTALFLPMLGLNALAWGLLAGALCRTVLTAVLTGIALMAGSWLWLIFSVSFLDLTLVEGVAAFGAGYASRRIFCRDDRSRQPEQRRPRFSKMLSRFPADLRVLLWLIIRQGRWVLFACGPAVLVLGFTVKLAPVILWPAGTFLLGATLGLAVFAPDQNERNRFLGSQRFPPGRLWASKVVFWGLAAFVLTALAWFVATVLFVLLGLALGIWRHDLDFASLASPTYWIGQWLGMGYGYYHFSRASDAVLLAGIWSLYGFCFGQFFGQLARRPVIATILTVFIAAPVACLWVPSFLVGDVLVWQVFILPVLMLAATRLTLRPWLAGRLWDTRPLLAIASAAVLMVISVAGCLWYRAVEVPDVGKPFDVKAFLASLPTPEQNQAGPMIRHAVLAMEEQRQKLRKERAKGGLENDKTESRLQILLDDALQNGWPQRDEEIGRWLDQLFEGAWAKEARKAAELPLGMIEDPRRARGIETPSNAYPNYEGLAELFSGRALQLQARGDSHAALNDLDTALALSRQMKNYTMGWLLEAGQQMERRALSAHHFWLEKVGPNKELLLAALKMLQHHEAATPNPENSIKAAFVVRSRADQPNFLGPGIAGTLQYLSVQVPWEKERQSRIMLAAAQGALRLCQKPGFHGPASLNRPHDPLTSAAALYDLPPTEGPGSDLSARQWDEYIRQSKFNDFGYFKMPLVYAAQSQKWVRGAQLITAVALYQADHGKPPPKLEDIVPKYLANLPNAPFSNAPFVYSIATEPGEVPNGFAWYGNEIQVVPGQALLWSGDGRGCFVSPLWKK